MRKKPLSFILLNSEITTAESNGSRDMYEAIWLSNLTPITSACNMSLKINGVPSGKLTAIKAILIMLKKNSARICTKNTYFTAWKIRDLVHITSCIMLKILRKNAHNALRRQIFYTENVNIDLLGRIFSLNVLCCSVFSLPL